MTYIPADNIALGWEAVDFSLSDPQGKEYSLKDFLGKKGLLVVFTCNHCPYAKAAWPRIVDLYKKYSNDISFVAINPNDSHQYPEDSRSAMAEKIGEWNIPFPYLRDKSQSVAKSWHAQCTPDPYLFLCQDGVASLVYHGRVDDNWKDPTDVRSRDLEFAIEALLQNKDPINPQHPSMGCSIKWVVNG